MHLDVEPAPDQVAVLGVPTLAADGGIDVSKRWVIHPETIRVQQALAGGVADLEGRYCLAVCTRRDGERRQDPRAGGGTVRNAQSLAAVDAVVADLRRQEYPPRSPRNRRFSGSLSASVTDAPLPSRTSRMHFRERPISTLVSGSG